MTVVLIVVLVAWASTTVLLGLHIDDLQRENGALQMQLIEARHDLEELRGQK